MPNAALENVKSATWHSKIVLANGLTVIVCEMPQYKGVHAIYGTNYGSVVRRFNLNGTDYTLPAGVAHFLEHKMFENEDGQDAFALYAKTGANANAYTSFDKTCYIFSATDNIDESLDILLSFVSKPYFTKETVEKEQGIIGQEIKMYDDSAEWRMMFAMFDCLYHTCPVKDDIAGSVESIAEITPQLLYACCDAFYCPQNMVLSVAGNITVQQVLDAVQRAEIPAKESAVKRYVEEEPAEIHKPHIELTMAVSQPIFGLGFKETPMPNDIRTEIICDMLTELLVGDTTPLYRKLYDEGLINPGFSGEYLSGEGYLNFIFAGETKDPAQVEKLLRAEITRLKTQGVDEEMFTCIKNMMLGDFVTNLESIDDVAGDLAAAHFKGRTTYDEIAALCDITVQDLNNALKTMLNPERSATVIIKPKA
ncbi:MAG: pitrilysin family protein [Oscillospiraceae bacterium]|nr:pitrilysin family protein [Oscillospiraceae bacterium]